MHRVRDARAVAKPVETWAAHLTDDVDHEDRTRRSLGDRLERRRSRPRARPPRPRARAADRAARARRATRHTPTSAVERETAMGTPQSWPRRGYVWFTTSSTNPAPICRQRRRLRHEVDELARDDDRPRDLVAVELRLDALRLARQCDELVLADATATRAAGRGSSRSPGRRPRPSPPRASPGRRPARAPPTAARGRAATTAPRRRAAHTAGSATPRSRRRSASHDQPGPSTAR